jgi:hypothetical protein
VGFRLVRSRSTRDQGIVRRTLREFTVPQRGLAQGRASPVPERTRIERGLYRPGWRPCSRARQSVSCASPRLENEQGNSRIGPKPGDELCLRPRIRLGICHPVPYAANFSVCFVRYDSEKH